MLSDWEGLAGLEVHGFLLVTDQYPQTFFGFVRSPKISLKFGENLPGIPYN